MKKYLVACMAVLITGTSIGQRIAPCRQYDEIRVRYMNLFYLTDPFRNVDPFLSKKRIKLWMPLETDPGGQYVRLGFDEFNFLGDAVRRRESMEKLNDDLLKIIKGRLYAEDRRALKRADIVFYDSGRPVRFKSRIRWNDSVPDLEDSFALPLRIMPLHSIFKDSGDVVIFAFWPFEGMSEKFDPEWYLNEAADMIKKATMRKKPRAMRLYYFDDSTQIVIEPSKVWDGWFLAARSLKPEHYRPVFWDIPYLGKVD